MNLFQKTAVATDGSLRMEVSPSAVGDRVTLGALMEIIVAFSACPQNQNPINDWVPTEIQVVNGGLRQEGRHTNVASDERRRSW